MRSPAHTLRITLPISFALAQVAGAQAFGPSTPIDTQLGEPWCVQTSDVDLDGDLDVLVAARTDGMVGWYENDGAGQFGPLQTVTTEAEGVFSFVPADLDGDGDEDLLVASAGDDTVAWHENTGGAFGPREVISTSVNGARSVVAADLDGDGALDAVVGSMNDDSVSWFRNLGGGAFGSRELITTTADFVLCVDAADMDGDGDMDVLSAARDDRTVAWYANDGVGGGWGRTLVSTDLEKPTFVRAEDLDGDGDADVVATSLEYGLVARFLNGGFGDFPADAGPVVGAGIERASALALADVDLDGDMDVLTSSYGPAPSASTPGEGKIAWFEAAAPAAFLPEKNLADDLARASFVHCADVTGDGRPDVLATSYVDGRLWLCSNDIPTLLSPAWSFQSSGEPAGERWDMDGDGDMDIFDGTTCRENLGGGTFGAPVAIRPGGTTFAGRDLNQDGFLDFVGFRAVFNPCGCCLDSYTDAYLLSDLQSGSTSTTLLESGCTCICTASAFWIGGQTVIDDTQMGCDTILWPGDCAGWLAVNVGSWSTTWESPRRFALDIQRCWGAPNDTLLSNGLLFMPHVQSVIGQADLNDDGATDLLFRPPSGDPTGQIAHWYLSGPVSPPDIGPFQDQGLWILDDWQTPVAIEPRPALSNITGGLEYTLDPPGVHGVLDLNGDGLVDLLMDGGGWRPGYGEEHFGAPRGAQGLPIPATWTTDTAADLRPDPIGDVNGDGRMDIRASHQGEYGWWLNFELVDCNGNGISDALDISSGTSDDCDLDGIPDECAVQSDFTLDLNANGTLDACEAIGTTYCSPAMANSTDLPGVVTILGNETVFLNDFKVSARQLPANAFGYFIASTTPGSVFPVSNSVGTLCVIGSVGRGIGGGIVNSGPDGFFYGSVNLNAVPQPVGTVMVQPGDTWHFQAWHRDASGGQTTSNFTDAVAVTFQ